ncbi:phage tail tape measure protein [Acinetobacter johnsonii]|uniref:Phage tail tape measure protein n=1 Tax=Acinetobacter johnsonii TaxID=40214 RepID=A0A3R9ED47_ACIJO|nr:hypothetical protein [Acinetobacter johnsonii]RSE16739.1 hypothetical protein EGT73_17780 [Acinetobacter johnsonii]
MSAKLGTLTLDLVTRIGNFVGPIKESEKQVKTSFASMQKEVLAYGAIAVSGATAAGAAVFAMAKNYADAAQELKTFAAISNATTQEFQAMSAAAQTVDINPDKLADQLKDFNEKLGEFITIGSGGAVDFFEQIAVQTEGSAEGARKLALEMQNLSGPQALQLYVDKLEQAGVSQQQMSFYLESMASDTTNLIPLLKNGGEGFKFWADAAERYGLIMDESAIQKAAEFKVQLKLLDMQVQGAKNQFIQGLMPSLVSVGDAMSGATTETDLMSDAGETLGGVFKGVAATGMGVYAVIKMLSNAIAGLAFTALDAKSNVDLAAEGGTWADKLPGLRLAKTLITGATVARAPNSGISMAAADNAKVIDDIGTSITTLFTNTVNEATAAMAKNQSGQAGVIKGSDEWIKKQNQAANATNAATDALKKQQEQARTSISYDYLDDFAKFAEDYKRQVTEIEAANFGPLQASYVAKAKARYEYEEEMYLRQITEEINTFKWSEEEKLKYAFETQRIIISESGKYNNELKELKLKALDEQHAIELRKTQWHALEMRQTLEDSISGLSGGADDIFAKATMSPQEYSQWSLESDRSKAQVALKNDRVNVERDIMTSGAYSTDDERYDALLKAHQEYRDGLYAIDLQYDQSVKDLAQNQFESQMGIWQDLLTRTGTIFSQVAEMVKNTAGESSAAYKAMFLVNQGISIAQALINTEVAATKAMAEGGFIAGIPMSTAIRALGYASVGLIAGQTIAGMAHDGIDNIPKEGTWLLDGGERVLNPQQNKDLTNYLASQPQQSSSNGMQGLTIINQIEQDGLVGNYMRGSAGGQIILNQIKASPSEFKRALGVS